MTPTNQPPPPPDQPTPPSNQLTPERRKAYMRELAKLTMALDQNEARLIDLIRIIGVSQSSTIIARIINDMEEHRKNCASQCQQICVVELAFLASVCAMQRANVAVASRAIGEDSQA